MDKLRLANMSIDRDVWPELYDALAKFPSGKARTNRIKMLATAALMRGSMANIIEQPKQTEPKPNAAFVAEADSNEEPSHEPQVNDNEIPDVAGSEPSSTSMSGQQGEKAKRRRRISKIDPK